MTLYVVVFETERESICSGCLHHDDLRGEEERGKKAGQAVRIRGARRGLLGGANRGCPKNVRVGIVTASRDFRLNVFTII